MDDEKRMVVDYEIFKAISVGDREVLLGENPGAEPGERYLCAYCKRDDLFEEYSEAMVSDEYVELLQLFGERVRDGAEILLEELSLPDELEIDNRPVQADGCLPVSWNDDLRGKVVVIKPEILKPEYRRATYQYQLVTEGSGAHPNSRGSACYCANLYNEERARYERSDILGVVPPEQMPEWVKDGLKREEAKRHREGER